MLLVRYLVPERVALDRWRCKSGVKSRKNSGQRRELAEEIGLRASETTTRGIYMRHLGWTEVKGTIFELKSWSRCHKLHVGQPTSQRSTA